MATDCLFCKIVAEKIPAMFVYEDELCVAFADINPQARTHVLIVPREHVASMAHLAPKHTALVGHLMAAAAEVARRNRLDERGYRLVVNTGVEGGQTIEHLHIHVLGGRHMDWPPG
ncbi:MAG: histidine triad nucleotide-binding protein [Acidobacteriota bacterium]|nr:histidine triad nucleotide-binding protein [Acidobacteriota bacterium]